MVIGERALGTLRERAKTLAFLDDLGSLPTATNEEVRYLVEVNALSGRGLSLVDAHLLASLRLSGDDRLWTRDRRLRSAADELGVAARLD